MTNEELERLANRFYSDDLMCQIAFENGYKLAIEERNGMYNINDLRRAYFVAVANTSRILAMQPNIDDVWNILNKQFNEFEKSIL